MWRHINAVSCCMQSLSRAIHELSLQLQRWVASLFCLSSLIYCQAHICSFQCLTCSTALQDWVKAYQQSRAAATAELLTLLTQVLSAQVALALVAAAGKLGQDCQLLLNNASWVVMRLHSCCESTSCQLILQASGCSSEVTEDTVEEGEVDRHVKGLVEQVKQVHSVLPGCPCPARRLQTVQVVLYVLRLLSLLCKPASLISPPATAC